MKRHTVDGFRFTAVPKSCEHAIITVAVVPLASLATLSIESRLDVDWRLLIKTEIDEKRKKI